MDPEVYEFVSEFYVIEKTIEVVVRISDTLESIRIEAIRDLRSGQYSTRAYIQVDYTIQPTYPFAAGRLESDPNSVQLWVDYELAWIDGDSADDVLNQALAFLAEDCR